MCRDALTGEHAAKEIMQSAPDLTYLYRDPTDPVATLSKEVALGPARAKKIMHSVQISLLHNLTLCAYLRVTDHPA